MFGTRSPLRRLPSSRRSPAHRHSLPFLLLVAAALGLAGCLSVEHLPPEDGGIDPADLAAAAPGSEGTLTWMSSEWDRAFEALVSEDLRRPGVFAEVRVTEVDGSGTPRNPSPPPARGSWVLSKVKSFDEGTGASFRNDFPVTLLTLGLWPVTSSRRTIRVYRLRREGGGASPGGTILVPDGHGVVLGLAALPLALGADWEFGSAKDSRRRRMADHLANEVLRAVLRDRAP